MGYFIDVNARHEHTTIALLFRADWHDENSGHFRQEDHWNH